MFVFYVKAIQALHAKSISGPITYSLSADIRLVWRNKMASCVFVALLVLTVVSVSLALPTQSKGSNGNEYVPLPNTPENREQVLILCVFYVI